jgi:hypothetical protein
MQDLAKGGPVATSKRREEGDAACDVSILGCPNKTQKRGVRLIAGLLGVRGTLLNAATRYVRPTGATTAAQRASVQGLPCVTRGTTAPTQVADRVIPLGQEHYESGSVDLAAMHEMDAVQPQCPVCSARQGAALSRIAATCATFWRALTLATDDLESRQLAVCARFELRPVPAPPAATVGVSRNVRQGVLPLNGLRHQPEGNTSGWYIWAGGEPSSDPNSFVPLHIAHLQAWCPDVLPYLLLPPGTRFQIAPGHEDVWEDAGLLDVRG